jgi:hypothetical protein
MPSEAVTGTYRYPMLAVSLNFTPSGERLGAEDREASGAH